MKFLPSFLVLAAALAGSLCAQNSDPITLLSPIGSQSIVQPVRAPAIDLRTIFAVPTISGTVLQFRTTTLGNFNVALNAAAAPNTVQNFLNYVNAGSFTNSLVHRSDQSLGVIQGGGFYNNSTLSSIPKNAPVALETTDTLPNNRGTLAMARSNAPDTATSEWFINTTNNSGTLPPASSGGYAVFGRVTGTGMSVVDAIAALPVPAGTVTVTRSSTADGFVSVQGALPANFGPGWGLLGANVVSVAGFAVTLDRNANQTIGSATTVPAPRLGPPFAQLPVLAPLPPSNDLLLANLVTFSAITTVPIFPASAGGGAVVNFFASSSNPGLVNAVVSGSNLSVVAVKNLTGSATIAVTAVDTNGNSLQTSFNVTVTRQVRDFTNDGNADLVFQNNAGQIAAWFLNASGVMTGSNLLSGAGLGDYRIVATADVNRDGITDFIFQNNAGQVSVWYLNASGIRTSSAFISTAPQGDWRIAAAADVNGDGNSDLIFQNNFGQIAVWFLNGSGGVASTALLSVSGQGDWRVKCAADVDGDGFADLVFQNNFGQTAVWFLNAAGGVARTALFSAEGLGDYRLQAAADVNRDGTADLIFQNNAGQVAVWFLNANGTIASKVLTSSVGLADWRVR